MQMKDELTHLGPSPLLDYSHPTLQELIKSKGWENIRRKADLIGEVYNFVRDEIMYGYPESFSIPASEVLSAGYGNCITKSTLLMALLRAVGVPCRFHAMTIRKVIFRGLLTGFRFTMAHNHPHHAWIEVQYNNKWLSMGGHIVDKPYLSKLQAKFPDYMGSFYGYGIAVLNFKNPDNRWDENDTFVQNQATETDLGVFESPDAFFAKYPDSDIHTNSFRYRTIIRRRLNKSIQAVREGR